MRRLLTLCACAAVLTTAALSAAVAAQASRTPIIGLGDQNATMFSATAFQMLGVKQVRYFIHWDAIRDPYQLRLADEYIDAAHRHGQQVLLHISTDDLRPGRGHLPTPAGYRRVVGALVARMRTRWGIDTWGTWNEANHATQPTSSRPRRAAAYYRQMRRICRGCQIVALDVLDQRGVKRYVRRFYRALGGSDRRAARLVGIHNYGDVNHERMSGTRTIIRAARHFNGRARFWITETGAFVSFGRAFPCSPSRAAGRVHWMFKVARRYRRYVDRMYAYGYTGSACGARFDTGLTGPDGTPRRSYHVFAAQLATFAT